MHNDRRSKSQNRFQTSENSNLINPLLNINEKTLRNLQEKKENPFWLPSHNAEIFEVRDILRQEKELKKAINRTKQNRKQQLDSHHRDTLKDNLIDNSNFYLTEQKLSSNLTEFIDKFNKANTNLNNNNAQPSNVTALIKIAEEKEKNQLEGKKEKIQKKINSLGGKHKESVRDFINKTREIILMKYSIDIKKERAVRLKETYNNEIESIKDSIFSMQEAKEMFENEFFAKFEKYVKYLIMQKDKEKAEENNLLEMKMKLDAEKKKLNNKISKQEEKKLQYEEYREFMIRIKEKILKLPEQYKEENIYNLLKKERDTNLAHISTIFATSLAGLPGLKQKARRQTTSFSALSVNQPEEQEKIERIIKYYREDIFKSAEELIAELQKMETDNIAKLNEYNDINNTYTEELKKIQRIKEDDTKAYEYNTNDIQNKERHLKELKETYKKLNEERNILMKEDNANDNLNKKKSIYNVYSVKNKYSEPQLYAKILDVYKSCQDLNYTGESILDNTKKTNSDLEINMLIMLKQIEKNMDFLINKHVEYARNPNTEGRLKQIEAKLDYDRKMKKNEDLKIQNIIDEQRKRKEMEERNNRIYIIPKRKVPEKCNPLDKEGKEKNDEKNEKKELTFEDYISY